ncbi:hypothetical protein BDR22DRAFT_802241 [Usnea florida]
MKQAARCPQRHWLSTVNNAKLWYLKPLDLYQAEKPYHINLPSQALGSHAQSNEVSHEYPGIRIKSLRGLENEFTLDRNGFQIFQDVDCGNDYFDDPDAVRRDYYPTIERLLKEKLGAQSAIAFTHDVRRREPQFPALPRGTGRSPQPIQGVHVDLTPRWAEQKLRMLFTAEESLEILQRRWQVLNVWRPLFGPLQDWPLALCDYPSIDPQRDLVPSDNIYTHIVTETYNVYHHNSHRWYFLGDMKPNELLVFKSYDSMAAEANARVCPHAAFEHPETPANARPRESIECLVYVVYPEIMNSTRGTFIDVSM